ncbi:hypothetical protein [Limnobacter sp.]|uniref:hypothetical protein n=1 Tax=Limnobacter sp. TaxID=2003368 RepID=UPI0025BA674E|nr:hypothetical protein [Limnobacter sp.]
MTTVNVTTNQNTVTVTQDGSSTVVENPVTTTVTATTAGPQGPPGLSLTVNTAAKVDKSVVYYDSSTDQFRADATITQTTLTDGGNF